MKAGEILAFIDLSDSAGTRKIMIFTEGTILKPKSRFLQYHFRSYLPIGDAVKKILNWQQQGMDIVYCTSRRGQQARVIADLLFIYRFPGSRLYFREHTQKYHHLVENIHPEILIEDDCKSIGGNWQMCITNVDPLLKKEIHSIVVEEFKGIDQLPASVEELAAF
jgi:hypothetical protein